MDDAFVLDASPIIILARAGALDIIEKLASRTIVPISVENEVLQGPDDPARRALIAGWGERLEGVASVELANLRLGKGETAVLALAASLAGVAVIDDRSGRAAARSLGIECMGSLGVVARAKRLGVIPRATPLVVSMIDAGLFVDPRTLRAVLDKLGESWH